MCAVNRVLIPLMILILTKNITGVWQAVTFSTFPPLEVFKSVGRMIEPVNVLSVKICPPQTDEEIKYTEKYPKLNCNFTHIAENTSFSCSKKVEPILRARRDDGIFDCFAWEYTVCALKYMKSWRYDDEIEEIKLPKSENQQTNNKELLFADLYRIVAFSYCFKQNTAMVFTMHTISTTPNSLIHFFNPENFSLAYTVENQYLALRKFYPNHDIDTFPDFLIPQFLIPARDMDINFGQKKNDTDENLRPQWKSLNSVWVEITDFIWYTEQTQKWSATHYTGATGKSCFNGKEVKIGKKKDKKSIPIYWWRLIHNAPNQNILIVMHNTPLEFNILGITKVCERSVCRRNGWDGIIKIQQRNSHAVIYCCEVDRDSLTAIGLSELTSTFRKRREVLELNLVKGDKLDYVNTHMKFND